jgi:type IX secretion system PorP/SprF family membrane protein
MRSIFTRLFFSIAILGIANELRAQQDPHYSQWMHNKLNLNAGFAGATDGKICATLLYRTQWMGFGGNTVNGLPQGDAPTNQVGSINASLGNHFGIGGTIVSDKLGFETMVMPRLTLSYRRDIGSDGNLAAGVGLGYMQRSLDGTQLKANDPNDPRIPPSAVSGNAMDFDFGLYYTKNNLAGIINNFYAGFSATHLNQNKIIYEWNGGSTEINSAMHMYFMTGGEYAINSTLTLQPNIIVKKDPAKIQTDLNCYLIMNGNIFGGLTWRPMDAAVLLAGYQFQGIPLYVGYSYDLTTSRIINYSSGSHEIVLRYCFGITIPKKEPIVRYRLTPRFM